MLRYRPPTLPASAPPLVSIGIPTFNRAGTLERSIRSALEQTHERLEVVISDNASSDETEEVCRDAAARDGRVRYLRQQRNLGPTANFNLLSRTLGGTHSMMLADDDWLDPGYVEACLEVLLADPGLAMVAGRATYHRADGTRTRGVAVRVTEASAAARVLSYYRQVDDNGTFYALAPHEVRHRAGPMPNTLGNDWFLVAAMAYLGRIETIEEVSVHRAVAGTSESLEKILHTFGSRPLHARLPHVAIAGGALADIAWRRPVYRDLAVGRRWALGAAAAVRAMDWTAQAWYVTEPLVAAARGRPGLDWIARAYDRLARALVERRHASSSFHQDTSSSTR